MLTVISNYIFYTLTFFSLMVIDYLLGNGFVDALKKIMCEVLCFIRRSFKKEIPETKSDVNLILWIFEIIVLGLTIAFLKKYKLFHYKDKIDDLMQESRETLLQTNEFLEKWRLRRLNCQGSTDYSYLDEEPQEIKPYKIEVPILRHIAIIDTLGSKSQLERGDAGDSVNSRDSTLLSMTSLLDDFQTIPEVSSDLKFEDFI